MTENERGFRKGKKRVLFDTLLEGDFFYVYHRCFDDYMKWQKRKNDKAHDPSIKNQRSENFAILIDQPDWGISEMIGKSYNVKFALLQIGGYCWVKE